MNFEINNTVYDVKPSIEVNNRMAKYKKEKAREAEILTEICQERDTSKYGAEVDKVVANMEVMLEGAKNGNEKAISELNAVQTITIERELVKRINLLNRLSLSEGMTIGDEYNDTVEFEYNFRAGKAAQIQDYHATFPFATYGVGKATMKIQQITAGAVTSYYRTNDRTLGTFGLQSRNAVDEMYNTAERYMFTTGYELIKNSPLEIKIFDMGAGGISKVAVDQTIGLLRKDTGSMPVIYGTYPMIMQMESWLGFKASDGSIHISSSIIDEINNNGVIGKYRGCPVVLINEGIDMTSIKEYSLSDGINPPRIQKWYNTILPEGIMYIVPSKVNNEKVLRFAMGSVKSMTGTDINNATIARRWDMPFASALIPTALPFVGFIGDENFPME